MQSHDRLFGLYLDTHSPLHRLSVGWKYLIVLGCTLTALVVGRWWLSLGLVGLAAALLLLARVPPRLAFWLGWGFSMMVLAIASYQFIVGQPLDGVMLGANLVGALWLTRVLTYTTPASVLIDALISVTTPLRRFGFPSERFGLAVAVMMRSIPYLVGSFSTVRDAARARGLERNWFARVTPVVVNAVAYAQRTGDALTARGLGDEEDNGRYAERREAR